MSFSKEMFWKKVFTDRSKAILRFMDLLCYLCLVFVMLSRMFIAALWSPARKELTSWLLIVMFNCVLSLSQVVSQVYRFLVFVAFLTLTRITSEVPTVWIQIRPGILLGLAWVQTVCKVYQQTSLENNSYCRANQEWQWRYTLLTIAK